MITLLAMCMSVVTLSFFIQPTRSLSHTAGALCFSTIQAYPSVTCSDGAVRHHSEGGQRRTLCEILCIQPDTSEVINYEALHGCAFRKGGRGGEEMR